MRRIYVTHPHFQYGFTFSFVVGNLLILLLLGGSAIGTLYLLAGDSGISYEQKLKLLGNTENLVKFIIYLTIPTVILLSFIGFYLSYKFVGPLYRLESWLELHLLGENPPSIVLRPGDELEPMTRNLGRILEKLKGRPKNQ